MNCLQCEQEFNPNTEKGKKFCSIACQKKFHNDARPRKPAEQKLCSSCYKVIETSGARRRFCSRACNITYHNKKQPRRGPIVATCKKCNKEFETSASKGGTFCSSECRITYFSRQRGNGKILNNNELRKEPLSDKQKSFVVGTVLGDGSMRCRANASLSICHSVKQSDYLLYKLEQIPFIFTYFPTTYEYTDKPLKLLKATSIAHPDLTTLYHMIYINGRKTITRQLLDEFIDGYALAFWFQDDGSHGAIATNHFTHEENQIIQKFLRDRFGLDCNIQYNPERTTTFGRAKESYNIRFNRGQFRKFSDIIRPHMHPSLLYKLK